MKGTIIYVTPNMSSYDLAVAMIKHEALYDTGITMLQDQLFQNYKKCEKCEICTWLNQAYRECEERRKINEQNLIDNIIRLNSQNSPPKKRLRKY
jgi:hypothetical protein